ncbi:RNA polymerase sigma-70 factor [Odoribacter sp. AF15-53]|uniref:RNA polymerase sigma-70 factor n=1 Tax=Odoribacter sp. AF15-53 TaxID=2292236 RepID=UPI002103229E|nr:RNA polymerase sigma-70 factor [Odoribacter sp. AF15-53]
MSEKAIHTRELSTERKQKDFFTENFPLYLQFALKYIADEDLCKDIVQEAFINCWKCQNNFEDEVSLKAFLYKSIRNGCLNQLRHKNIRDRYLNSLPEDWETEDYFMENVIREEVADIVLKEVDKLSETSRKIILRSLDGFSNEEIAEEFGVSVNTIKTHKARSYIILRKKLEHLRFLLLALVP